MDDIFPALMRAALWAPPLILAITLHEAAHGFVALRCGDQTAYILGRVTLNPLKHIDPIGTLLLPGLLVVTGAPFLFGYAKPVPVNFRRLNSPRIDMVKVAIAGPAMNIFLALASAAVIRFLGLMADESWAQFLTASLTFSIYINVLLAVFNMLPIPPLDGGRVAVGLLPDFLARPLDRLERFGFVIVIGLLVLPGMLRIDFNLFRDILQGPIEVIVRLIGTIVGLG